MSYQTSVNCASHQIYLLSAKSLKFILFLGVYVLTYVRMCVFAHVFGDLHTYVSACSRVHASIVE